MIKYLGSKRVLVPVLGEIAAATGARTALDLFTGTTRVAQEFKRRGLEVTATDSASYSEILAQTYIATDAAAIDQDALMDALLRLSSLPGSRGYVTRTFCEEARYFQPKNGMRIDAIRDAIEEEYAQTPYYPILLTSLMLAADRVDSTAGIQMAYLKDWAARSYHDLELRMPELLPGAGYAARGDALSLVRELGHFDLAYLDPPYNQHRYFTNYHIWETLVRWDAPEHYGKACKRVDARDDEATRSPFNSRKTLAGALRELILAVDADTQVVSYNNESWVTADEICAWLREAGYGAVATFDFDHKRYVGAQIGIHNLQGDKVGTVGHLRNIEHIIVAGATDTLAAVSERIAR